MPVGEATGLAFATGIPWTPPGRIAGADRIYPFRLHGTNADVVR